MKITSYDKHPSYQLLLVRYTPDQVVNLIKVIREKSRVEGSLIVQDTIENVSEPKFFF